MRKPLLSLFACVAALMACDAAEQIVASDTVYVVDGDTIDIEGKRYRLLGFDTPETYNSGCTYEKKLGEAATRRLRQLIQSVDTVTLHTNAGTDKYDRTLASLEISGQDVGDTLISEGLARSYDGGRRNPWCE